MTAGWVDLGLSTLPVKDSPKRVGCVCVWGGVPLDEEEGWESSANADDGWRSPQG